MADVKVNQQTGELAVRQNDGRFAIYQPGQFKFNSRTKQYAVPAQGGWKLYDSAGTIGPTVANATAPTAAQNMSELILGNPSDLPPSQRLRQGVTDIGQGAVQLINHLFGGPLERNFGGTFDEQVSKQQGEYAAKRQEAGGAGFDAYRLLGNVAATLPAAAPATAETIPGLIASGAISGAMQGALAPVTEPGDFTTQKLEQAGIGGGIGALTGGALGGVSRMVAPEVRPEVQALLQRGVRPTMGQIAGGLGNQLEEKVATVIPGLGDVITGARHRANAEFNRAVYNEVLQPIGAQVGHDLQPGRDAIRAVENTIRDQYNQILPNVTLPIDQQLSNAVQTLRQDAINNLPPQQAQRFEQIVTQKIGTRIRAGNGVLDGDAFKGVESELSNDIRGYRSDPSHDNRELADYLGQLLDEMRNGLERNNPMHAPQLQAANAAWARFTRLQRAAGSLGNDMGEFTPAQFQSAVKAGDSSVRKGAFARGDANMQELSDAGRAVLANKFPNSGTPGRMAAAAMLGGGAGYLSPAALGVGALGSLAYTPIGQRLMASAMTHQGPVSASLARLLRLSAGPAAAGASSTLLPSQ